MPKRAVSPKPLSGKRQIFIRRFLTHCLLLSFLFENSIIPISFKNDKLEETTLFDAEKGGFPQTPIREKAKIYSGIHVTLFVIAIFIEGR